MIVHEEGKERCGTACEIEGLFFGENSSDTERFSSARSAHLPR